MKNNIIISALIIAVCACQKIKLDNHDSYIRGKVQLIDTISGENISASIKNFTCKLYSNTTDTADYIYSVLTNDQGYFIFNVPSNVSKNEYFVGVTGSVAGETFTSRLESFKKEKDTFDEKTIKMTQKIADRTYAIVNAVDTLMQSLSSTRFFLYTNTIVATSNFSTDAIYTYTADANGQARIKDINPGTYYVNALAVYTNSLTFKARLQPLTISKGTLLKDTIVMHKQ